MTGDLVRALGWALLHLVWQGAVIAALLAAALWLAPARAARIRYALACAALLAMLTLPVLTATRALDAAATREPSVSSSAPAHLEPAPAAPERNMDVSDAVAPGPARSWLRGAIEAVEEHSHEVVVLWAIGVLLASARVLLGWSLVAHLKRRAQSAPAEWQRTLETLSAALGIRRRVRLLASARVDVPSTIGWLKPAVLVPLSVLADLPARQLELILAHELAHIRRHDYLVNLLQTAAETLLFYHPAVWWIGNVIREERENCCDDLAVAATGTAIAYARALTALETLRAVRTPAMSALGGSLPARVRRLVVPVARCGSRWSAGASVLTLLAGLGLTLPMCAAALPSPRAEQPARAQLAERVDQPTRGRVQNDESGQDADPNDDEPDADESDAPKIVGRDALSAKDLVALRIAGVDGGRIREVRELGFEPTVENLVSLGHASVTASDVKAMRRRFGRRLSLEDIVSMKHVGVTPEYVASLAALGYGELDAQSAISARAVGLTPEYARDLSRAGVRVSDLETLTSLRAVGVDAAYVAELRRLGLRDLDAEKVQSLRAVGVNARWVEGLEKAGLTELTADRLETLRALGVDGAFVRRMKAAGLRDLSVDELQELKANGITPEYLDQLRGR